MAEIKSTIRNPAVIDPLTAQYKIFGLGKKKSDKGDDSIQAGINAYYATPEWQKWVSQGRAYTGGHSYADAEGTAAALRAEDKRIAQYYELATGKTIDEAGFNKYVQYASDPALLAAAINKESALAPTQGKFKGQISSTIQDKMGRAPTEAELGYFGKQMEQGNLDAYGLGEFLSGTTEYQNKASDVARGKLSTELGNVDTEYLNKVKSQLESKYAAMGRPGASAFGSALIGAGKDIANQRTGYLAGLGYQDFQQGQGNLTNAYQNRLSQMYQAQQGQAALGSESRGRYYSQMDRQQAAAAAERLRRLSQPSQQSFLQSMLPGVIQAGLTVGGNALLPGAGGVAGGYLGQKIFATKGVPAGGYNNLVQSYGPNSSYWQNDLKY